MPFCPNCRTEYVLGTTQCADCGAELIASLPQGWSAGRHPEQMRPAELCELDDQVQADLIETQLRAAGIPTARRPRRVAIFVPETNLQDAQQVMAGRAAAPLLETLPLSELSRIRLVCEQCDKPTSVDLLEERLPDRCSCGHYFDLAPVRSVLDRYGDLMRTMANADFEIELELPQGE